MLRAVISDIHANIEALEAVLSDIQSHAVDHIDCLGDLVGYGADPIACVDLIRKKCRVVLCGNHDHAVVHGTMGFSDAARAGLSHARKMMRPGILSRSKTRRRWHYLASLPHRHQEEDFLYVHASPRDPLSEYLMPEDPRLRPEKLEAAFTHVDSIALVGHTHLPGIFSTRPHLSFKSQKELGEEPIPISSGKTIVNVGSVGQPRDQDPRACYLLCKNTEEIRTVQFRRVPYDIEKAMTRIRSYSRLPLRNAERLGEGC